MADTPKWDDTEEILDAAPSWDDTAEISDAPEETPTSELEKMGALEAGVTGFGSGASFGLTPILGGIAGAGREVVEDIGDMLGITDDAKLRDQGFKLEDDNPGLQGLMDAYYKARDGQKKQEEKAFEDQPAATLTGNIAGGLSSFGVATKLAANLAKGGKVAKAAASLLPKAESVKDLSLVSKAGIAAREGAKAGALTGFGSGDAKLGEGEILDAITETGTTALGGAVLGGVVPLAGAGVKKAGKFAKELPFVDSLGLGYKAGKMGIDIGDESQVLNHISEVADEVRSSISKNFKGANKAQVLKEADEIGIRVAAGETIDDVVQKIKDNGAFNQKDQKQLIQFVNDLKGMSKGYDPELQKAVSSIEKSAAKKAMNAARKGGVVETRSQIEGQFDDLAPMPDQQGRVIGVEDKVVFPGKKPNQKILTTAAIQDAEVPIKQYDLQNMKLSELDQVIRKMGTQADFQGAGDATSPYAKEIYARLREASNEAMSSSTLPERNKKLKSMFDALESLGVDPKEFFSSQEIVQDKVQKQIFQKITSGSMSGDLDMNNFAKYLGRADERLAAEIKEKASFAKDLAKFARQSDGEGSISPKAFAGPIQKVLAKTGGLAGSAARTASEAKSAIFKRMADITPDQVIDFGEKLSLKYADKAQPFINALTKAAASEGTRKNALMYGIYQQPAFRQMLQQIGQSVIGEEDANTEDSVDFNSTSDIGGELPIERTPQSVGDIDTNLIEQLEGNKTEGYIPTRNGQAIEHSGVTIAGGLDLGQRTNLNDINISEELKQKFKPYLGLKTRNAQQFLSENPLEVTEEDVAEINSAVKNTYFDKTSTQYERLTGKNINELPAPVQTVLFSLVFNTGKIGKDTAKLAADGDYRGLVSEVRNWHRNKKVDEGITNRRNKEADYLEQKLNELRSMKK